jgi:hypothetical protein
MDSHSTSHVTEKWRKHWLSEQSHQGTGPGLSCGSAMSLNLAGENPALVTAILIYVLMAAILFWRPEGLFPART